MGTNKKKDTIIISASIVSCLKTSDYISTPSSDYTTSSDKKLKQMRKNLEEEDSHSLILWLRTWRSEKKIGLPIGITSVCRSNPF